MKTHTTVTMDCWRVMYDGCRSGRVHFGRMIDLGDLARDRQYVPGLRKRRYFAGSNPGLADVEYGRSSVAVDSTHQGSDARTTSGARRSRLGDSSLRDVSSLDGVFSV